MFFLKKEIDVNFDIIIKKILSTKGINPALYLTEAIKFPFNSSFAALVNPQLIQGKPVFSKKKHFVKKLKSIICKISF